MTTYEAGRKAAEAMIKRRTKTGGNPFFATPSHKLFTEHRADWDEFQRGWMDAIRAYKEEITRG